LGLPVGLNYLCTPLPNTTPDNRKYIRVVGGYVLTAGAVQFRNLPGGTEGNHEKSSDQNSRSQPRSPLTARQRGYGHGRLGKYMYTYIRGSLLRFHVPTTTPASCSATTL